MQRGRPDEHCVLLWAREGPLVCVRTLLDPFQQAWNFHVFWASSPSVLFVYSYYSVASCAAWTSSLIDPLANAIRLRPSFPPQLVDQRCVSNTILTVAQTKQSFSRCFDALTVQPQILRWFSFLYAKKIIIVAIGLTHIFSYVWNTLITKVCLFSVLFPADMGKQSCFALLVPQAFASFSV